MNSNSTKIYSVLGALLAIGLIGCGGGDQAASAPVEPAAQVRPNAGGPDAAPGAPIDPSALAGIQLPDGMTLNADAGVRVSVEQDPEGKLLQESALASRAISRTDPFALLTNELRYEKDQTVARIIGDGPLFNQYFEIPEPKPEEGEISEPAPPNLRLAGIIMGDGVSALLDFNGQIIEIRPGTRIPNTEWTVVSIDTERAVLRRSGNKRPKEIVVYLSGKLGGGGGGGNTGNPDGGPSGPGSAPGSAPGRDGRGGGRGGRGGDGNSAGASE